MRQEHRREIACREGVADHHYRRPGLARLSQIAKSPWMLMRSRRNVFEDGERLIEEATRRLAERAKTPLPDLRRARTWLAAKPLHRSPLYATAAAVHSALSPSEAFGLSGGELLRKLAGRELDRVRPVSESMGLGRNGLEHLLALGVLADGLSEGAVGELARVGACEGSQLDIVSALSGSPWWRRGRLVRLEPDAPAAAFVELALFGKDFPRGRDAPSLQGAISRFSRQCRACPFGLSSWVAKTV